METQWFATIMATVVLTNSVVIGAWTENGNWFGRHGY